LVRSRLFKKATIFKETIVIDSNDEQLGRILAYLMAQKPRNGRAGCPDEETLASYLAGGLTPSMCEEMETHLAQCTACLDELSAAYGSMVGDEKETVPEGFVTKAMALVPHVDREGGFFDMVVRLARGSLELVSTTGQLVEVPGLAGVRGKLETSGTTILQVEKEIGRFKVAVEVEPVEDELCQLAVTVRAGGTLPADGIRLSLLAGGREQASYLARQGTAIFDRVSPGDYRLAITENNAPLGSIRLTIKEGHHGV
jgi:Putative zinc-finger